MTYYYDGEGERVAKSTGKLYLFGTGSAPVVETDASGTMTAEYVFFGGKRVAMRKADNSVHYYFADQIGSANVVTNATGAMPPEQDIEYHPYGEQQVYTDTLGQQYKFTGHEHDPETNNDYFGARYYSSAMGRFLTPDWAATPVPIPYAVMGNPQTLNLYSYVENNPITGTDPDGHADDDATITVVPATASFTSYPVSGATAEEAAQNSFTHNNNVSGCPGETTTNFGISWMASASATQSSNGATVTLQPTSVTVLSPRQSTPLAGRVTLMHLQPSNNSGTLTCLR